MIPKEFATKIATDGGEPDVYDLARAALKEAKKVWATVEEKSKCIDIKKELEREKLGKAGKSPKGFKMSQSETKTYTFGEMEVLKARLVLAEHEIECLRSVLSEFDGDKTEYVQMNRANILRDARETL